MFLLDAVSGVEASPPQLCTVGEKEGSKRWAETNMLNPLQAAFLYMFR